MTTFSTREFPKAASLSGVDLVLFELSTRIDADFFAQNPDVTEYCRSPHNIEIEMGLSSTGGMDEGEFRMVVNKVNDDTFLRRLLWLRGAATGLVAVSLVTDPGTSDADLQSHHCGEICST